MTKVGVLVGLDNQGCLEGFALSASEEGSHSPWKLEVAGLSCRWGWQEGM